MKRHHWLTWGRGKKLLSRWIIAVFPLFVTLGVGTLFSIPIPGTEEFSQEIFIGSVAIGIICLLSTAWFTKSAAEVLFCPRLHHSSGIVISTLSLTLVAIVLTYLGYLLFHVSLGEPMIPSFGDVGVGFAIASLFALFLSVLRLRVIRADRTSVRITEEGRLVHNSLTKIRDGNADFKDTENLVSGLEYIAKEMKIEPLVEDQERYEKIQTWCTECSKSNTLISRLRMIPDSPKSPTTERTRRQVARFEDMENDLRMMSVTGQQRQ
ncbi:hypothetical protein ACFQJ7_01425 [Halovenus rubra]|uniref:Uncharacterized protein n=2 Tax=Halovenus rubra TaxID=869890 RepID=A0ABD5X685_9EURY|nr:hypothetical protein [Halovenus rubra]